MEEKKEQSKLKKRLLIILIVLLFLISAAGVVYLVWVFYNNYMAEHTYNNVADSYVVEQKEEPHYAENPVDFASLQAINVNSKDFSDPVTLVYGHNMRNDTMFCMLHEFEDKEFFDNNEYFYIYTPNRKLTYRIVSALKYDNRRITTAFDFSDESQIKDYQYSIMNPKFNLFNSRDIVLKPEDKIVTLSTCVANKPSYRYLVNGVLIKDEPTQ